MDELLRGRTGTTGACVLLVVAVWSWGGYYDIVEHAIAVNRGPKAGIGTGRQAVTSERPVGRPEQKASSYG